MKTKFFAILLLSVSIFSCSSDDAANVPEISSGVYMMSSFKVEEATDLNGDGNASNNLMSEFGCFNNSLLTLNADHTFSSDEKGVEIIIEDDNSSISCFDDGAIDGTWEQDGNKIILHYTMDGEVYDDSFVISGSTLKFTIEDGMTVGIEDDVETYVMTDIVIVYTKQ